MAKYESRFERTAPDGTLTRSVRGCTTKAAAVADATFAKHALNGNQPGGRAYVDTYADSAWTAVNPPLLTEEIE